MDLNTSVVADDDDVFCLFQSLHNSDPGLFTEACEQNVHMTRRCASVPMCGGVTEIPDLNCGVRQCCVHVLSVILLLFIISTRYPKTPPHKWFKGSGGIFSANMIWLRWHAGCRLMCDYSARQLLTLTRNTVTWFGTRTLHIPSYYFSL